MKILYHHRIASSDGQAVHVEEMINAFRELGHDVMVVAPDSDLSGNIGSNLNWVHKLKTILPRPVYEILEFLYSFLAYFHLRNAVVKYKPDFLYERYNLYMIAGMLIKHQTHIPYVLEVNSPMAVERNQYGGLSFLRFARWCEGLIWRTADCLLPVTNVLANYADEYCVSKNRVLVLHNGVNLARFNNQIDNSSAKQLLNLEGKLVIGFTGFVRDWHGLDRVIHWMAKKPTDSKYILLVVGDGPARKKLEVLAENYNLTNNIVFTGVLSRDVIPKYIAAFDIALQPAVVSYASPLKLFEYLALGKPVIAPNTPNLCEVLDHQHNAMLFSDNANDTFEEMLEELCINPDLRVRLGESAISSIYDKGLTWQSNAHKIIDQVQHILSAKK